MKDALRLTLVVFSWLAWLAVFSSVASDLCQGATQADYLAAKDAVDTAKTAALAEQYDADVEAGDCEWHRDNNTPWYYHYIQSHDWSSPVDIDRTTYELHESNGEYYRGYGNNSMYGGDSDYNAACGAYSQGEAAASYGCWDTAVEWMGQAATKFGLAQTHYGAAHAYYDLAHYSYGMAFGYLYWPGFTPSGCCDPFRYQ